MTGEAGKLTKREWALLEALAMEDKACYPRRGGSAYGLRLAGYADWDDRAGNGKWWLAITPAGRTALSSREDGR